MHSGCSVLLPIFFMIGDICSFLLCIAYVASSRQASCLFLTYALSMQCSVTHLFHDTLKNAFLFNRFTTQNAVAVQPVPITNPFGTLPAMPQVSFGRAGTTPSVQYGISTMPVTINCPEFVYSRVSLIFHFFVFLMQIRFATSLLCFCVIPCHSCVYKI
jgi:hypothetical protein